MRQNERLAGASRLRVLDEWKKTILVVSHEATRSGAPILALNIIQQLSPRYNVVSLILGGGELTDHFRQASASLYVADRIHMTDQELDSVIQDIVAQHQLVFGIVNSVESRGGAEGVEGRWRSDRLADPRVLILHPPPFGVSRRSHAVNRNSVLDRRSLSKTP